MNTDQAPELPAAWEDELRDAVGRFDWPRVTEISQAYVRHLRAAPLAPLQEIKEELQLLRESLRYDDLRAVADAALGQGLDDAAVRRQYAQAVSDEDNPAAALLLFLGIVGDPSVSETERIEARGGVGRCWKQLFVVTIAPTRRAAYLIRAVDAYLAAYREDHARIWHGINAAALLARAERERLPVPGVDNPGHTSRFVAAEILSAVKAMPDPDAWSRATASEALLVLGQPGESVRWGNFFVRAPDTGAFKIAAYLRQLREIWQLDTDAPPGDTLLPVLRSALLKHRGGGDGRIARRSGHSDGRARRRAVGEGARR